MSCQSLKYSTSMGTKVELSAAELIGISPIALPPGTASASDELMLVRMTTRPRPSAMRPISSMLSGGSTWSET
jgi:hypothetical protein